MQVSWGQIRSPWLGDKVDSGIGLIKVDSGIGLPMVDLCICSSILSILTSGKETRFFWDVIEPRRLSRSGEKSKEIAELNTQLLNRYSILYGHILSIFYVCIFWRATECWRLLCLCRSFMIFEGCLDSKLECCRSMRARPAKPPIPLLFLRLIC